MTKKYCDKCKEEVNEDNLATAVVVKRYSNALEEHKINVSLDLCANCLCRLCLLVDEFLP